MKGFKDFFLMSIVLFLSLCQISTVFARNLSQRLAIKSSARPSLDRLRDITLQPHPLEDILDGYDRFEVQLVPNATDKLSVKYVPAVLDPNPDPNDPEPHTKLLSIKADDVIYVWSEITVFEKWGPPGTELAQWNGYRIEGEDLEFNVYSNDFVESMKPPPPATFFRLELLNDPAVLDHPFNPNENPADLDLQNGAVVSRRLLFALKSECDLENSEKSAFCSYHEIGKIPYFYIITGSATGSTMQAVRYDKDPDQGGNALSSTPIIKNEWIQFIKSKNQALKVMFKSP